MQPHVAHVVKGWLTLPTFLRLTDAEVKYVADQVTNCYIKYGAPPASAAADDQLFSDDEN